MKLPAFEYASPATLSEAASLLAQHAGDARVLAGGQSLLPLMAFRLAAPSMLVDIARIPDLRTVRIGADGVHLGPLVRWCDIERHAELANHQPLLCEAVSHIAHYQVRNRGTVGGSLAHADPAAELPCIAVTCDAKLTLLSHTGTRIVDAAHFIIGELSTDLQPDEIIIDIHFPAWPQMRRWAFREFAKRRGDFALGGVALYVDMAPDERVESAAIGVFGASTRPLRLSAVETLLRGKTPDEALIRDASAAAREVVDPAGDIHASTAYRKALIGTLVGRALTAACTGHDGMGPQ